MRNRDSDEECQGLQQAERTVTVLSKDLFHDSPVNIGQPSIDAIMPDGKSMMIDTQQVHDRRVDIVNRGWMLSIQWLESPLVTWSDTDSPADSTTAQPIRKAKRIVVPTAPSLRGRHPTEFGGPKDECILKHPSLFQVTN